jgi:hypothetical protein
MRNGNGHDLKTAVLYARVSTDRAGRALSGLGWTESETWLLPAMSQWCG